MNTYLREPLGFDTGYKDRNPTQPKGFDTGYKDRNPTQPKGFDTLLRRYSTSAGCYAQPAQGGLLETR